jgi:methyl-accepting chemotaxis protein
MLIRVGQFGASHAHSFPAGSRGAELFTAVAAAITNMETRAAAQQSHARAAKETTTQKGAAFEALQEQMEAISRTARAMSRALPGVRDKFRVPHSAGVQTWLAAARSFAEDAEPIKDEFIRRGMDANFIETLRASIEAVAATVNTKARKAAAQVGATSAVGEAAEDGRDAVRELDAIVRNVFRNDPSALAEWESASHVERAARHTKPETPSGNTPHS